jgi:hypothetical protein
MGSGFAALVALIVRLGSVLPVDSAWDLNKEWQFWLAVVANGAMMGIAIGAITIAPRFIMGSEVALVYLMESLLGPFWVWLFYKEALSIWTLAGGFGLIALHEAMPLLWRNDQQEDWGVDKEHVIEGNQHLHTEHKSFYDQGSSVEVNEE